MKSMIRRVAEERPKATRKAVERLLHKHPVDEVIKILGLGSTRSFYQLLRDLQLPIRKPFDPTDEEIAELTPRELSEQYEVHISSVYSYLRRRNGSRR